MRLARHHGLVTTWMRCYWDEDDVWFYFEVDAGAGLPDRSNSKGLS